MLYKKILILIFTFIVLNNLSAQEAVVKTNINNTTATTKKVEKAKTVKKAEQLQPTKKLVRKKVVKKVETDTSKQVETDTSKKVETNKNTPQTIEEELINNEANIIDLKEENKKELLKTNLEASISNNTRSIKEKAVNIEVIGNIEKIKLKILNTCVLNQDFIMQEVPQALLPKDKNSTENLIESENIDNIDSLIENPMVKLENIPENEIANTLFQKYLNITDKKQIDYLNQIWVRVANNLNITNLYTVKQEIDSCKQGSDFINKNKNTIFDDFVYSNFNKDSEFVVYSLLKPTELNDEFKLEIYIVDIIDQRVVSAQYYIVNKYNLKRISNIISDFIYTKTTGESKGFFDSKILYISETGSVKKRRKNIKIMNFNGENDIKITNDDLLTLTPIFSRFNKNEIYYLQYRNRKAYLYKENLISHERNILKIGEGIVFSPNFNPQNKNQIVLSMSDEHGTNLYLLNNENNKYYKLTNDPFINTSPSFGPDGKTITYVSDKTGTRKLYSMSLETGEIVQITKGNGIYDKPMWAPDEKLIAFIKIEKGKFKLGLMTPDGENERYLTESYLIEGIKWSPNSRYIVYSKQTGPFGKASIPQLYIIDILTNHEYKLNTPAQEGASDPDWLMND